MKGQAGHVVLAVAWIAIVAVLALGAAGIVATMAHQPGTAARPELTYAGDAAAEPGLKAARTELDTLSGQVAQLSDLGRTALGHLSAGNSDELDATVTEGQDLASTIEQHATAIRQQLETLPGLGPDQELTLSPGVRRGPPTRSIASQNAPAPRPRCMRPSLTMSTVAAALAIITGSRSGRLATFGAR